MADSSRESPPLPRSPMSEPPEPRLHPRDAMPWWTVALSAGTGALVQGLSAAPGLRRFFLDDPAWVFVGEISGPWAGAWRCAWVGMGIVLADRLMPRAPRGVRWWLGMLGVGIMFSARPFIVSDMSLTLGGIPGPWPWARLVATVVLSPLLGAALGACVSRGRRTRWLMPIAGCAFSCAAALLARPSGLSLWTRTPCLHLCGAALTIAATGGALFAAAIAFASRYSRVVGEKSGSGAE